MYVDYVPTYKTSMHTPIIMAQPLWIPRSECMRQYTCTSCSAEEGTMVMVCRPHAHCKGKPRHAVLALLTTASLAVILKRQSRHVDPAHSAPCKSDCGSADYDFEAGTFRCAMVGGAACLPLPVASTFDGRGLHIRGPACQHAPG